MDIATHSVFIVGNTAINTEMPSVLFRYSTTSVYNICLNINQFKIMLTALLK